MSLIARGLLEGSLEDNVLVNETFWGIEHRIPSAQLDWTPEVWRRFHWTRAGIILLVGGIVVRRHSLPCYEMRNGVAEEIIDALSIP